MPYNFNGTQSPPYDIALSEFGLTPDFEFTDTLFNSGQWTEVIYQFTAAGNEEYVYFGNFRNDADTEIESLSGNASSINVAYVFVDDVSLNLSSDLSVSTFDNKGNATFYLQGEELMIKLDENVKYLDMKIFDISGKIVLEDKIIENKSQNFRIDVSTITTGAYILSISNIEKGMSYSKLFLK
ncbi:MAG: T9SS type A sorting domain-containing protein [Flavobacteriaceae bacterium]|nr:T9SS type A sorting domain-containing protein [Flavobacteriaceae bacterium]